MRRGTPSPVFLLHPRIAPIPSDLIHYIYYSTLISTIILRALIILLFTVIAIIINFVIIVFLFLLLFIYFI